MFTGIIQAIGQIDRSETAGAGVGRRGRVQAATLDLTDVAVGDSICINGACMTVTSKEGGRFTFDVSPESLARTSGLDRLGPVNLEKSLRVGDRLDGHLVSGHVDGTGRVREVSQHGEHWTLVVEVPRDIAPFCATKGSIAIHGVSLTINEVVDLHEPTQPWANGAPLSAAALKAALIRINLIPHTVAMTTLGTLRPDDAVNLEVDPIARYVARYCAIASR